jgi:acetyltransferase-like isoleucine patch superfamily enzyme
MANTLYNTEGGDIWIGEDTFAGHNVMLLTGHHDYTKFGKERIKVCTDKVRNIIIGNGVWLCSGCIIIGPCTIGDNAVISAGSVVGPNTVINEYELWMGNPAIFVKLINKE